MSNVISILERRASETTAQYKARRGWLIDIEDLGSLDQRNPGMDFEAIVKTRLDEVDGAPLLALRVMVRRGMDLDDELDRLRLALHQHQVAAGEKPTLRGEELIEIRYRLEMSNERSTREMAEKLKP